MAYVYKKQIPLVITVISFAILFIEYFLDINALNNLSSNLQSLSVIIMAFAIGIGVINSLRNHSMKILNRNEDWILSLWMIILMVVFFISGVLGRDTRIFSWLFDNVYSSLSATTYSILSFYITTAAFRAFRARNIEASALLVSGFFILLGNTPAMGAWFPSINIIRDWIMQTPTAAVTRIVVIGAGLGMISLAVRSLIGKETGYLGAVGEE